MSDSRSEADELVRKNIAESGCHVYTVFDPEEKTPNFSYSIGIQETTCVPEAIVIGLSPKLGHFMINEYKRQARTGVQFGRALLFEGFLEGFPIYVERARRDLVDEYVLGCLRYYGEAPFEVVQLIYPSTKGIWPWEDAATEWFKNNQPLLCQLRPDQAQATS